jgi:AhpC/TSA family
MTRPFRQLLLWMIVSLVYHGTFLRAADEDRATAKPAPLLPTDKDLWLNASPYTWEQLRGKGVVLLFFSCDTEGTELFPKYLESAKLHALDPVVYVGISMGTDRFNTEQFLKTTKFNWPTLCDPTYTYTRQCDTCVGNKPEDSTAESVCVIRCM